MWDLILLLGVTTLTIVLLAVLATVLELQVEKTAKHTKKKDAQ